MLNVQPTTLAGYGLQLRPLSIDDAPALEEAAADGALWQLRVTSVPSPGEAQAYIATALSALKQGNRCPFLVTDLLTGQVLGSTSYHDILPACDRLEIGYTWYRKSVQRTHVNTGCKLLLMQHAFETLGAQIVGWRTDILNFASQKAIQRLGAKREGVMLRQALRRDGSVRDTVLYSMPVADWPAAKAKLLARLESRGFNAATDSEFEISLETLTALEDVSAVMRLSPGPLGSRFVAENAASIAQASAVPYAWLRGIRKVSLKKDGAGAWVGLVLIADPSLAPVPDEPENILWVWRLMVDLQYQGQGIGDAAMKQIVDYARGRPGIDRIHLSYVPLEGNAKEFYARYGFIETGRIDHGEIEMCRLL